MTKYFKMALLKFTLEKPKEAVINHAGLTSGKTFPEAIEGFFTQTGIRVSLSRQCLKAGKC